jgi:hypothetical protein
VTDHSGIVTDDSGIKPKIGHLQSESAVTFARNDRSRSIGISGQLGPEYALKRGVRDCGELTHKCKYEFDAIWRAANNSYCRYVTQCASLQRLDAIYDYSMMVRTGSFARHRETAGITSFVKNSAALVIPKRLSGTAGMCVYAAAVCTFDDRLAQMAQPLNAIQDVWAKGECHRKLKTGRPG